MASSSSTVQRNFHLPLHQAEWLRDYAHRTRRPQAEIVRDALAQYRERSERDAVEPARARNRALVRRFEQGHGIDLEVLRDEDGTMWSHEA